ncbi:CapA family protein [Argonema antarcticum]|uniref:CapA family protein n=1 Tax=Argonema antarcticum TaxID=2942763 RepID=UPI0020124C55|nr:CapA family protein [Argonema antarcticum]MCL1472687.1 CapA family protein [Argonema antarcticum A004/B2]
MRFTPLLIIFILLISGCDRKINPDSTLSAKTGVSEQPEAPQKPKAYTKEAKLIAVGDILMHMALTRSGYNPQKKTYNFDHFFKEVKPIIATGDWAIANLEIPVAGPELGYSEYPIFNAPAQIVDAAKGAGFNILTNANNHALDKGEKGIINTIKNIRSRGLPSVGTATSPKEAEKILIVKKNDISMAVMAYTFGTNGIPIPKGKNYLVSLIDENKIIKDIARAKKQGADAVTISLHFGDEYQRQPNAGQKQLVKKLIESGADIILGCHPHVVQPYQILKLRGKDGKPRTGVVIYSMGNFIAYQIGSYKDLGVIFSVNIRKRFPEKTIEITNVEAIPTWTHNYTLNNNLNFRVLPIEAVVNRKNDPLLPASKYPVLKNQLLDMKRHLKSLSSDK